MDLNESDIVGSLAMVKKLYVQADKVLVDISSMDGGFKSFFNWIHFRTSVSMTSLLSPNAFLSDGDY